MLTYICVLLIVSLVSASIDFKKCGNSRCQLHGFECNMERNGSCIIRIEKTNKFTSKFVTEHCATPKIEIYAVINKMEIHIKNEQNACNYMSCPIEEGKIHTLIYEIVPPKIVPECDAYIKAKLICNRKDKKELACIRFHAFVKV